MPLLVSVAEAVHVPVFQEPPSFGRPRRGFSASMPKGGQRRPWTVPRIAGAIAGLRSSRLAGAARESRHDKVAPLESTVINSKRTRGFSMTSAEPSSVRGQGRGKGASARRAETATTELTNLTSKGEARARFCSRSRRSGGKVWRPVAKTRRVAKHEGLRRSPGRAAQTSSFRTPASPKHLLEVHPKRSIALKQLDHTQNGRRCGGSTRSSTVEAREAPTRLTKKTAATIKGLQHGRDQLGRKGSAGTTEGERAGKVRGQVVADTSSAQRRLPRRQ